MYQYDGQLFRLYNDGGNIIWRNPAEVTRWLASEHDESPINEQCMAAPPPSSALPAESMTVRIPEGAMIELVDWQGRWLMQTFEFEPGAVELLGNFATQPPDTNYPGYICDFLQAERNSSVECRVAGPPTGGSQ